MRNMLYIIWGSLCLLLVISGCKSTDGAKAPVSLRWELWKYSPVTMRIHLS